MVHNDDFRWFGDKKDLNEWDARISININIKQQTVQIKNLLESASHVMKIITILWIKQEWSKK